MIPRVYRPVSFHFQILRLTTPAPVLIRIVRMTLRPETVPDFLVMFQDTSPRIRSFPGCRHLELWEDARYANILTTYSLWRDGSALRAYRESELFKRTWARTREWFAAPTVAHSYTRSLLVPEFK